MITDCLLGYQNPLWFVISVAEFALVLLFWRKLPWRSDDMRVEWAETVASFACWYGVHLLHLDFLFDFSLNVAVLMGYAVLSRSVNARQALYFACTFVLCTEIGKVVCVDLIMQPASSVLQGLGSTTITLVWAAVSLALTAAATVALGHWTFIAGTERLTWKQCLFLLLPLVPYMYIRSNYFYESVAENTAFYWNFVWMMLILSGCTVVMIVANAHNLSAQLERNELVRMQMLLQEQNTQYIAQTQANEAVRRRYHDLRHYMTELERLLATEGMPSKRDAEELLTNMRSELLACTQSVETGNEVLDVVLGEKARECARLGVKTAFFVDAGCLSFMSAFDVCTLFGNLVDNAVEAASRLAGQNGTEPEISLDVRRQKGFASVRCANPYTGNLLRMPNGNLATTKDAPEEHGIGLRSVRATVERYGGALTIDTADGMFTVTAILPIPEEGSTSR